MSTNISSTEEIDIPDMGYAMKFLICLLGELCLENKNHHYIIKALKAQDKFGQTPMLSSINAAENR